MLVIGAVAIAQLIPVRRTNPPSEGELPAPPEIAAILDRACSDCHSNHTRWHWYGHVAPFSWRAVRDVEYGRRQINFSEWGSYYTATRIRKLRWTQRALQQKDMPPRLYRLMHPEARLSADDRALLMRWIDGQVAALTR